MHCAITGHHNSKTEEIWYVNLMAKVKVVKVPEVSIHFLSTTRSEIVESRRTQRMAEIARLASSHTRLLFHFTNPMVLTVLGPFPRHYDHLQMLTAGDNSSEDHVMLA